MSLKIDYSPLKPGEKLELIPEEWMDMKIADLAKACHGRKLDVVIRIIKREKSTEIKAHTCATCVNGIGRELIVCFATPDCSEYPPEHVCGIGKWEERER